MKDSRRSGKKRPADGEAALLRRIEHGAGTGKTPALRLAMGDDAALLTPRSRYEMILTCDWLLDGVHFLQEKHPADAVGWKCLARGVSDIAAMGGEPRCFLLSLGLPATYTGRWLGEFLGGLRRAERRFGCSLAGGDTTRTGRVLINVTAIGEVRRGRAVLRSGARAGDAVFVSGRLGEAELGLQMVRRSKRRGTKTDSALRKHLYPKPRLALGQWLAEKRLASAMMDLSDGLSTDLARLCAASRAGARLYAEKIPTCAGRAAARRLGLDPLRLALDGGDDYELLFTVRKDRLKQVPKTYRGVALILIGEITAKREIVLVLENGRSSLVRPGGWDPFAEQ